MLSNAELSLQRVMDERQRCAEVANELEITTLMNALRASYPADAKIERGYGPYTSIDFDPTNIRELRDHEVRLAIMRGDHYQSVRLTGNRSPILLARVSPESSGQYLVSLEESLNGKVEPGEPVTRHSFVVTDDGGGSLLKDGQWASLRERIQESWQRIGNHKGVWASNDGLG